MSRSFRSLRTAVFVQLSLLAIFTLLIAAMSFCSSSVVGQLIVGWWRLRLFPRRATWFPVGRIAK